MSFIGDINFCQLTSLARPNAQGAINGRLCGVLRDDGGLSGYDGPIYRLIFKFLWEKHRTSSTNGEFPLPSFDHQRDTMG